VIESARSRRIVTDDREGGAVGYYEEIISGPSASSAGGWGPDPIGLADRRPEDWVGFREADVVNYLDREFLLFELKPNVRRVLFGQPFVTNDFGMHDGPVSLEKAPGTFRVAVLGTSMDMGWGVKYQDTYVNRLQDWLESTAAGSAGLAASRYEVLNFAVAAYSPFQRLEALRLKALAFRPDLVLYSATTLDTRLMEIHLCDMLQRGVDLKYDFLKRAVAEAGLTADDLRVGPRRGLVHKDRVKKKLRPYYWRLYDEALGALAAECRAAGVPLAMMIVPRVGRADAPAARAEPVARLKALAEHHALTLFDLSSAFDAFDPATLEIAAWDDHPNAIGHEQLFWGLARSIVADPELSRLVFAKEAGEERDGAEEAGEKHDGAADGARR
jgi:hypothetical protein